MSSTPANHDVDLATLPSARAVGVPSSPWILVAPDGRVACFSLPKSSLVGLAAFRTEGAAYRYAEFLPEEEGLTAQRVSWTEAQQMSRNRLPALRCVIFLDQLLEPVVVRWA